jgi:hypothetical protein
MQTTDPGHPHNAAMLERDERAESLVGCAQDALATVLEHMAPAPPQAARWSLIF